MRARRLTHEYSKMCERELGLDKLGDDDIIIARDLR